MIIVALIAILCIILVLVFFFSRPSAIVTLKSVSKSLSDTMLVSVPARQAFSEWEPNHAG